MGEEVEPIPILRVRAEVIENDTFMSERLPQGTTVPWSSYGNHTHSNQDRTVARLFGESAEAGGCECFQAW